jgi:hypothetical protein
MDDNEQCPFSNGHYDVNVHDALRRMRFLKGDYEPHEQHGPSVDFFRPGDTPKFWVKKTQTVFG